MNGTLQQALAALLVWITIAAAPPLCASDSDELAGLQARVAQAPHDTDAHYSLARAHLTSGRFHEAAGEFDLLLALDPRNADWLLGRAQAALALERPREAVRLLERARTLAPGYQDVWLSEAIALEAEGRHDEADELLEAAVERFPGSQWPATQKRRLHQANLASRGTRVGASMSYEELSGAQPSWRSGNVSVEHPLGSASRLVIGAAVEQRYDAQDEQLALGLVRRLQSGWVIEATGAFAPDAGLLPDGELRLEVGRSLTRAVSASLRYRHAAYASVDVDALAAATEYGFGNYRAAYTLTAAKPTAIDPHFAHALRFARDYGEGSSVSLLLARGEEAESVAPGQVLVTRNTSVALFGTHWRSAAWGLTWSCGWVEQGELYERIGVRLGFEHRF